MIHSVTYISAHKYGSGWLKKVKKPSLSVFSFYIALYYGHIFIYLDNPLCTKFEAT